MTGEELTTKVNQLTTEVESLKTNSNTNTTNISNLSNIHQTDIASLQGSIDNINSNLTNVDNELTEWKTWKLIASGSTVATYSFDDISDKSELYFQACGKQSSGNKYIIGTHRYLIQDILDSPTSPKSIDINVNDGDSGHNYFIHIYAKIRSNGIDIYEITANSWGATQGLFYLYVK